MITEEITGSDGRGCCGVLPYVRYSKIMRRDLLVALVVCSLLWAVCGMSVLAMSLHEHSHHATHHDHEHAIRVALHGHAHENPPDHDHVFSALVGTSRNSATHQVQVPASQSFHIERHTESSRQRGFATDLSARDTGPPPYVMHCVLLT